MQADGSPLDAVVSQILQLLEKDVADNWKTCSEYFMLLKSYASNVRIYDILILYVHMHCTLCLLK